VLGIALGHMVCKQKGQWCDSQDGPFVLLFQRMGNIMERIGYFHYGIIDCIGVSDVDLNYGMQSVIVLCVLSYMRLGLEVKILSVRTLAIYGNNPCTTVDLRAFTVGFWQNRPQIPMKRETVRLQ
jgi:hypothetical protein